MRVAYFGYDSSDATTRTRVRTFKANNYEVDGFMNKRLDGPEPEWNNVELCETDNGAYLDRILSVFKGAFRAAKHKQTLAKSDLILARNLDMLATAFLTKRLTNLKTPVVYECLDIHRLLCRQDVLGWLARKIEGALLKRCRGVLVSSPAFVEQHFERHYAGDYRAFLIENRLPETFANQVERPKPMGAQLPVGSGPLRLGWVGILRCQRTLDLMVHVARALGDKIDVQIFGKPDLWNVPKFHETIEPIENITFHGAYRAPEDLPEIYGGLDLVWSGDFMEAGLNSTWLLPNRIYEGGSWSLNRSKTHCPRRCERCRRIAKRSKRVAAPLSPCPIPLLSSPQPFLATSWIACSNAMTHSPRPCRSASRTTLRTEVIRS